MVADMHTVHCKSFKVENFCGVEMNCNLLENIHSCMLVLCGQSLLYRCIIAIYFTGKFSQLAMYQSICEDPKLFHLEQFAICSICDQASEKGPRWHKIHHIQCCKYLEFCVQHFTFCKP